MTNIAAPNARYLMLKRAIDIVIATGALVLLVPVLLGAALAIRLSSPGPIFFRQPRLGKNGRVFTILKLRTMTDVPRATTTEILAGHREVTAVGALLRRWKLDEVPQVLNVLKGEMSIVGPRPGVPEQLAEYTPLAMRRLAVRPGLTGLAQVNGNIHLSWPERWAYDAEYVERMSLRLDLAIMLRTFALLIRGESAFRRPPDD